MPLPSGSGCPAGLSVTLTDPNHIHRGTNILVIVSLHHTDHNYGFVYVMHMPLLLQNVYPPPQMVLGVNHRRVLIWG